MNALLFSSHPVEVDIMNILPTRLLAKCKEEGILLRYDTVSLPSCFSVSSPETSPHSFLLSWYSSSIQPRRPQQHPYHLFRPNHPF